MGDGQISHRGRAVLEDLRHGLDHVILRLQRMEELTVVGTPMSREIVRLLSLQ